MKRQGRLSSAPSWMKQYNGKNLVKGYAKHFGVDKRCAVVELQMLGVEIDKSYIAELERSMRAREEAKRRRKEKRDLEETVSSSDETFAFIAGYTSGGAPYGLTWKEMEEASDERDPEEEDADEETSRDPLPF